MGAVFCPKLRAIMKRPSSIWRVFFLSLLTASASAADLPPFDPNSTMAAPCGAGIPPPGHLEPELWAPPEGMTLTVRQDRDRLCYTANGSAEAPIIRVRLGSDLTVTLRNEITDPAAIDAVTGPGKLSIATGRVPRTSQFIPVSRG
jgi:hypothetical protein